MGNFQVDINTTVGFDTIEEARDAAQLITRILNSGEYNLGGLRIEELNGTGGRTIVPTIKPVLDYTKIVRGGQEAEANARALTKEINKIELSVNADPLIAGWVEWVRSARKTGKIDAAVAVVLIEGAGFTHEDANSIYGKAQEALENILEARAARQAQ